jgi:hypothetical protein
MSAFAFAVKNNYWPIKSKVKRTIASFSEKEKEKDFTKKKERNNRRAEMPFKCS